MNNIKIKKRPAIIMGVVFLVIVIVGGGAYFQKNNFTYTADCKIDTSNSDKIIFKQTLGTFDPSENGLDVYFIMSPKIWEELNTLADNKNIDINKNIVVTFQYNKLVDISNKKRGVYFTVRKLIDIEKSNYVPHL